MKRGFLGIVLVVLLVACTQATPKTQPTEGFTSQVLAPGTTTQVSVATGGAHGNNASLFPAISGDGRFVTFRSFATNLVIGDTNGIWDIFVHDRSTSTTTRVSVATGGAQGNNESSEPAISANGRFVTFHSAATNLVSSDSNIAYDVFVHDRDTGTTTRVSVATGGGEGNGDSLFPAISGDGRFVTFRSFASNLVSGDTNGEPDIFVHDRSTGTTTRISVATGGAQADSGSTEPAISADGRFVTFRSIANNLVSGDTNGWDIFVHDRSTGTTTLASVATGGAQGNSDSFSPAISADGRFVTFRSSASNLVSGDTNTANDVFVHDRNVGTTTRVSVATGGAQANGNSYFPAINADGRFVAFLSTATNFVSGDTNTADVFVHDRSTGTTTLVSVSTGGAQGNNESFEPAINADGRFVTFYSFATNLVSGDTNGWNDVFVHAFTLIDTTPPTTTLTLTPSSPDGSNSWYITPATASVTAVDDTLVETSGLTSSRCILDPAGVPASFDDLPATPVCPYLGAGASVGDGTHMLYAASIDNAGNRESVKTVSFKVDGTAPVVVVTGVEDGGSYLPGSVPEAGCSSSDGPLGSGIASEAIPITVDNGDSSFTTTCTNSDVAGNNAFDDVTYTVGATDTTPPDISIDDLPPMPVEATSPAGATVTWTATATDDVDGPVSVSCDRTSGETFALDSTTVTCSASDAAGNPATESFTVSVRDTTPPTLSGTPANQVLEATNASGATATYSTPSATDIVDTNVSVNCDPASGSVFPLGTTTVACTATDDSTNGSSSSFTITVQDTTPPAITWVGSITNGASYYFGEVPAAPTCTATDSVSGSVACSVSGYGSSVGSYTLTATATDGTGNTKQEQRSYTVLRWTLNGFFSPIAMPTPTKIYNLAKKNKTIALTFEVFAGSRELTNTSVVTGFVRTAETCDSSPVTTSIPTTTGNTSLSYTGGQFVQKWKTPNQANTCYKVTLSTTDGSSLVAYFKLTN